MLKSGHFEREKRTTINSSHYSKVVLCAWNWKIIFSGVKKECTDFVLILSYKTKQIKQNKTKQTCSVLFLTQHCKKNEVCKLSVVIFNANKTANSQSFLRGEVLESSDHSYCPSLDSLQQVHVFILLETPELDAGMQEVLPKAQQRERIASLDLLVVLLLIQSRIWVLSNFLSASISKSSSRGLLSIHLSVCINLEDFLNQSARP